MQRKGLLGVKGGEKCGGSEWLLISGWQARHNFALRSKVQGMLKLPMYITSVFCRKTDISAGICDTISDEMTEDWLQAGERKETYRSIVPGVTMSTTVRQEYICIVAMILFLGSSVGQAQMFNYSLAISGWDAAFGHSPSAQARLSC